MGRRRVENPVRFVPLERTTKLVTVRFPHVEPVESYRGAIVRFGYAEGEEVDELEAETCMLQIAQVALKVVELPRVAGAVVPERAKELPADVQSPRAVVELLLAKSRSADREALAEHAGLVMEEVGL